ncbi:ABC transporter ATP-binding protein, partial [Paenarthrobacter nicotinovorans]
PVVVLVGPPLQVLSLARSLVMRGGVWVRGFVPATRARARTSGTNDLLLAAQHLAVSRDKPRRKVFRTIPPVPVQTDITAQA